MATSLWSAYGGIEQVLDHDVAAFKCFDGMKHKHWKLIARRKRYITIKRGKGGPKGHQFCKAVFMKGYRLNERSRKPSWNAKIFIPFEGIRMVSGSDIKEVLSTDASPSDWAAALSAEQAYNVSIVVLAPVSKRLKRKGEHVEGSMPKG